MIFLDVCPRRRVLHLTNITRKKDLFSSQQQAVCIFVVYEKGYVAHLHACLWRGNCLTSNSCAALSSLPVSRDFREPLMTNSDDNSDSYLVMCFRLHRWAQVHITLGRRYTGRQQCARRFAVWQFPRGFRYAVY